MAILFLSIWTDVSAQPTWRLINHKPFESHLYAITLPDDSAIVAVGTYGAVHLSFDGGTTWHYLNTGTDAALRTVAFSDPANGIAAGDSGTILRTSDSGHSWQPRIWQSRASFRSTALSPGGYGIIVGERGIIARTEDRGGTWSSVQSNVAVNLNAVAILGTSDIVAVGDNGSIIHSTDQGRTWAVCTTGSTSNLKVVAVAGNTWHAVGDEGEHLTSTDRGANWVQGFFSETIGISLLKFFDDMNGVMMCRPGIDWRDTFLIRRTTDGGGNWETVNGMECDYTTIAAFRTMNKGVSIGLSGSLNLFHPTVQGTDSTFVVSYLNNSGYTAIDCSNEYNCTATGYKWLERHLEVLIERTTDGGITWAPQRHGLPQSFFQNTLIYPHDVYSFDSLNVIVVGDSGTILRTGDAGATWVRSTYQGLPAPNRLLYVSFSDSLHGVIGTYRHYVLRTSDGGRTWIKDSLSAAVGPVYQADASTTFALGEPNLVYRTTDGGGAWRLDSLGMQIYPDPILGVDFVDNRNGWIAGKRKTGQNTADMANSVLLRTTNSGESWNTIIDEERWDTPFGFTDIDFIDAQHGIIAGDGDTLLHTQNGGETWEQHALPAKDVQSFIATGLAMTSPHNALVVGTRGHMFQYRDDGSSDVKTPFVHATTGSATIAVLPNPTSGRTSVVLNTGLNRVTGNERLTLYNSYGQSVRDLSSALQKQFRTGGEIRIELNVADIPAGIYFLRLTTGITTASCPVVVVR